jgi:hypothetical protein
MNKRITVQAHLSVEQVEARYRKAQDPVERSHWQIIWLVAHKKPTGEISEVTGYSASWIYTIVQRYNQQGPAGVGDRRHNNPGGTFILSAEQQEQLQHDLDAGAPDGGLWTGRDPWPARSIPSAAGNISNAWGEASECCARAMPRPILPRHLAFKKKSS